MTLFAIFHTQPIYVRTNQNQPEIYHKNYIWKLNNCARRKKHFSENYIRKERKVKVNLDRYRLKNERSLSIL